MNETSMRTVKLDMLTTREAWSLFSLGVVVLLIGSPISTLVAVTSSKLAKREYASFINVLIAFYSIAVGKQRLNF